MAHGSIIFVHGTGVRLESYCSLFTLAQERAQRSGITSTFVECAWGDPLGIEFQGLSLPDEPTAEQKRKQDEDFAQWSWLFADPLSELERMTIVDRSVRMPPLRPGMEPRWLTAWNEIVAYQPTEEMRLLLQRAGIDEATWLTAWNKVTGSTSIARRAFQRSAHELPEAGKALVRAQVAQLHSEMVDRHLPGPSRRLRDSMVTQLNADWELTRLSSTSLFGKMIKRVATRLLKRHRNSLSESVAPMIGDILLYQTHGEAIRKFIRGKIEAATGPVTIIAHSLGGIACVDLLALPDAPKVDRLITVGSQAPLLYEIGALYSLRNGQPLPPGFPKWLNIFDRNDMLSYVAGRLFPSVTDLEVESGQPFPDAHSAYFGNDYTWAEIVEFIKTA